MATNVRAGFIAPETDTAPYQILDPEGKLVGEMPDLSPERLRVRALVGGPVRVAEAVGALLDAGLDGLMFNLPDADDLDTVRLAGHVLCDALGTKAT